MRFIKWFKNKEKGGNEKMAREPEPEVPKEPKIIEREVNLSLINSKLNELLNAIYPMAQKMGIDLD